MIDLTKPLTTQGGYAVRDVHRLSKPVSGYEWIGLCQLNDSGALGPVLWTREGSCQGLSDSYTLINKPEELEVWVNLFPASGHAIITLIHSTEAKALVAVSHNSNIDYLTIAYPVKIPLGYGVEQNDDD